MMARNKKQAAVTNEDSLSLRTVSGKSICEFSGETVASLRRMLTGLMYQATMPKSIANVAALRGEGVTYITLAMAAVLANDVNASVCAVELNWWHPGMHLYVAGQPPAMTSTRKQRKQSVLSEALVPTPDEGLGAVLRGTTTLAQAVIGTSLPNLSVLPSGTVPPDARSVFARSAQLKSTIEALGEQFDYLIFDVPAVAATSDTVALTSLAAGVAVVVRQGVTPVNTVKSALDEVKHVPVLGVILNQVQVYTPRWILNLLPQE